MAEVIDIPKPKEGVATREHSSLEGTHAVKPKGQATKAAEKVEDGPKGKATAPKKSFGDKLKETFIAEDARDVGDYILWDILVPTIKRTIRDVIVGSADRVFLGTNASGSRNLYSDRGVTKVRRVDYGSASRTRSVGGTVETRALPAGTPVSRPRNNFDILQYTYSDREMLTMAFDEMVEYIETYERMTVDDFADILSKHFDDIPQMDYTAQSWGWRSIATAEIVPALGGGYMLKMPRPVVVK